MRKYKFTVWFSNGNYDLQPVTVMAFNQQEAIILAQADRIKNGLDYTLHHIDAV